MKALLGPEQVWGHDLGKLLKRLEKSGGDLFADGGDRHLIINFIQDLGSRDPDGDQGRYPTSSKGAPSLAAVCCANPALFRKYVDLLFLYTQDRISRIDQAGNAAAEPKRQVISG